MSKTQKSRNSGLVAVKYNQAIGAEYTRAIKGLIRSYYTSVSEAAINDFLRTGDFARLTAEQLLSQSGFDLFVLENQTQQVATKFIKTLDMQANSQFRSGYVAAKKPMPVTKFLHNKTANLISQQVQKIKGLQNEQYNKINNVIQQGIVEQRSVSWVKKQIKANASFSDKKITQIASQQLHYATNQVYDQKAEALGIKQGIWFHPTGNIYKTYPRKTHVDASGTIYDLDKGCKIANDEGVMEYIHPGQLYGCKCFSKYVI